MIDILIPKLTLDALINSSVMHSNYLSHLLKGGSVNLVRFKGILIADNSSTSSLTWSERWWCVKENKPLCDAHRIDDVLHCKERGSNFGNWNGLR